MLTVAIVFRANELEHDIDVIAQNVSSLHVTILKDSFGI